MSSAKRAFSAPLLTLMVTLLQLLQGNPRIHGLIFKTQLYSQLCYCQWGDL